MSFPMRYRSGKPHLDDYTNVNGVWIPRVSGGSPLPTLVTGVSGVDGITYTDIGDPTSPILVGPRAMAVGTPQFPAFNAALAVDLSLGTVIEPGAITANFVVSLIGTYLLGPGIPLWFIFLHDATANVYTITWPANFKKNFALTNTALAISAVGFICDGANYVQFAASNALA